MIITSATLRGSDLILSLANPLDAGKVIAKFNSGDYELRRVQQKRSLDANAYAWVLIYKIAAKMKLEPIEVYRQYIRDLGCKVTVTTVSADDVELEADSFVAGHRRPQCPRLLHTAQEVRQQQLQPRRDGGVH